MSGTQEKPMLGSVQNVTVFTGIELRKQRRKKSKKEYYDAHKEEIYANRRKFLQEKKEYNRIYGQTHREQICSHHKKYRQIHKEELSSLKKKYHQSHKEEHNAYGRAYSKTPAGRVIYAKASAKRNRELGFKPLNECFEGSEGHHIGREYVIFIPKELHQNIRHSLLRNRNMKAVNHAALDYLFTSATI